MFSRNAIRWSVACSLVIVPFFATESRAAESSCSCSSYQNQYGDWVHRFFAGGGLAYECGGSTGTLCHGNEALGLCSSEHPACGSGLNSGQIVEAAASPEDAAKLLALPGVRYNAARGLIQVQGCDGQLVASIPLGSDHQVLAALL